MNRREIFQWNVYNFVLDHLEEIKDSPDRLGFKNYTDMLHQIRTNLDIASWAFRELMAWGLKENYKKGFIIEEMDSHHTIYNFNGQQFTFKINWSDSGLGGLPTRWTEVKLVTKENEITHWKEVI